MSCLKLYEELYWLKVKFDIDFFHTKSICNMFCRCFKSIWFHKTPHHAKSTKRVLELKIWNLSFNMGSQND